MKTMLPKFTRRTITNASLLYLLTISNKQQFAFAAQGQNLTTKFALVIGNANYTAGYRPLKNALNDARLIDDNLQRLGFNVTRLTDLTLAKMSAAVDFFKKNLPSGATSFVFYAGHGMEIGGANYLIPVDTPFNIAQSTLINDYVYPLKFLLEKIASSQAIVSIVVLDACRDNRFQPTTLKQTRGSTGGGFAAVYAPRGTLLAYATSPGYLALDSLNKTNNSPYTTALATIMMQPGLSLEDIFKQVGLQVRNATRDEQIPWTHSTLTDKYFFIPPDGVAVRAGTALNNGQRAADILNGQRNGRGGGDLWFRNMSETEWRQLDWDIEQQAKNLTPDGLPALEHKAKGANVVAQTTLARYWLGKNNTKALVWLRMAAKVEFPIAQTELGEMYFEGKVITRDFAESRKLLQSAAQANYTRAKLDLLHLNTTETGKFNTQDVKSAFDSILKSTVPPEILKK